MQQEVFKGVGTHSGIALIAVEVTSERFNDAIELFGRLGFTVDNERSKSGDGWQICCMTKALSAPILLCTAGVRMPNVGTQSFIGVWVDDPKEALAEITQWAIGKGITPHEGQANNNIQLVILRKLLSMPIGLVSTGAVSQAA